MCEFDPYNDSRRIDTCMKFLVENIDWLLLRESIASWKVVACCCGHGKYPMTIVVKSPHGKILEICSDEYLPRKKKFYKKDTDGYYFIPETTSINKASLEVEDDN